MKILLVDDEAILREVIAESLTRSGHNVSTACDGVEGLKRFLVDDFDCVLSDWNMPRMNGLLMVTEILKKNPDQRIVMISGDYSNKPPEGVRMLRKPFSAAELIEVLTWAFITQKV